MKNNLKSSLAILGVVSLVSMGSIINAKDETLKDTQTVTQVPRMEIR